MTAKNFRPEKKNWLKVNDELWEVCGLMVIALVSECQAVWVKALAGSIVLCSWTQHLSLSTQVYKWELANLMLGVTL